MASAHGINGLVILVTNALTTASGLRTAVGPLHGAFGSAARTRRYVAACALACVALALVYVLSGIIPATRDVNASRRLVRVTNTTECASHWWVFQATKEYTGIASVGGAGAVLASLVSSTTQSPCVHGTVLLPLYSTFAPNDVMLLASASAELLLHVDDARELREDARSFNVYQLRSTHPLYANGGGSRIQVLLLGPPTGSDALAHVYSVPGPTALYESTHKVPAQVRDFVFAAQVTAVMDAVMSSAGGAELHAAVRARSAWQSAPPPAAAEVVVQLHGAPTALVAPMITQHWPPNARPAIVYTMHDIAYEFLYRLPATFDFGVALDLLEAGQPFDAPDAAHATEVAFRFSDCITTVSTALRKQLAEYSVQEEESPLRDVLCEALQSHRLHGINNALSDGMDPTQHAIHASLPAELQTFRVDRVMQSKRAAKEALIAAGVLPKGVGDVALFIGRFEGVKGFHLLPAAADELCKHGAHLAVMGMFPAGLDADMVALLGLPDALSEWHRQLLATYARLRDVYAPTAACSVTLVDTAAAQAEYGILLRAAADVGIIPSLSEAFGLVAEESLLFGALPVASDAGGLLDIVTPYDRPASGMASVFP